MEEHDIATMEEIKGFWTEVLRDEEVKLSERFKASELLTKTYDGDDDTSETIKIEISKDLKEWSG